MTKNNQLERARAMTIGELLDLCDPAKRVDGYREVQKLLPIILHWAADYYNYIEGFNNSHWAACWRALELAALLVRAVDIVEEDPAGNCVTANNIIDWLALIALFTNEIGGLKPETRAHLKQISDLLGCEDAAATAEVAS